MSNTNIEVNPDISQAHALRGWFDSQGGIVPNTYSLTVSTSSQYGGSDGNTGGGNTGSHRPDEQKTFSAIKDENLGRDKAQYFVTKGIITHIKHDTNLWYDSCPNQGCQKKVISLDDHTWECTKCDQKFPSHDTR